MFTLILNKKECRVIIPADTYENVIKHHHIDMWLYANNYSDEVGIHRFDTKEEAEKKYLLLWTTEGPWNNWMKLE